MRQIEINSENWQSLLTEITENYVNGELIRHDWLKQKFGLAKLRLEDFETVGDFVKGLQTQQFSYMALVDTLRWQLLENNDIYIRNVYGDGYVVIAATDQVKYGYDRFLKHMRKNICETDLIINNVRPVPSEQQSKDNDIRAKYSILKQMLQSVK